MAKNASRKGPLKGSLDSKIEDLIYRLLEEKSLDKKRLLSAENEDGVDEADTLSFAKDLVVPEIFTFCQTKDLSMLRVKKVILQKSIERVLKQVIDEEAAEFDGYASFKDESAELVPKDDNLVPVQDNNEFNKNITDQWAVRTGNNITDGETEATEAEAVSSQAKKRVKEAGTGKSKRQKVKENRTPPSTNLESLGGMDDVIAQLMELIGLPILHPEIYLSTGVEPPRGVLLHGPPGCGKTSIANALAGELQVPFISVSAPSIVSGMSGESEKN